MMCFAKVRMFGKIAKLFKRSAGRQSETPAPALTAMPEQKSLGRPKYAVPGMDLAVPDESGTGAEESVAAVMHDSSSGSINVPFTAIMQLVPKELHGKVAGIGSASYPLPKTVALEQLPRGAVKIAFGDLRRAAPAGLFAGGTTQDSR